MLQKCSPMDYPMSEIGKNQIEVKLINITIGKRKQVVLMYSMINLEKTLLQ